MNNTHRNASITQTVRRPQTHEQYAQKCVNHLNLKKTPNRDDDKEHDECTVLFDWRRLRHERWSFSSTCLMRGWWYPCFLCQTRHHHLQRQTHEDQSKKYEAKNKNKEMHECDSLQRQTYEFSSQDTWTERKCILMNHQITIAKVMQSVKLLGLPLWLGISWVNLMAKHVTICVG